jgi:hypothetical protein
LHDEEANPIIVLIEVPKQAGVPAAIAYRRTSASIHDGD